LLEEVCASKATSTDAAIRAKTAFKSRQNRAETGNKRVKRMSAFTDHKEELEHYEQMFGTERGRLAVALDRMTNALVLAGQHGVYCTSQRNPTLPAMDLRMINQELVHAKELVQSVMEEIKRKKEDGAGTAAV
jgi:hypothetical protein